MTDSLCAHCRLRIEGCQIEPDQPVRLCVEARPIDAVAARSMQWIVAGEGGMKAHAELCRLIEVENTSDRS